MCLVFLLHHVREMFASAAFETVKLRGPATSVAAALRTRNERCGHVAGRAQRSFSRDSHVVFCVAGRVAGHIAKAHVARCTWWGHEVQESRL